MGDFMDNLGNYKLNEIIELSSLQTIQDKFAKITNLSVISVDRSGKPITKPSNFSKFCSLIRSSKVGRMKCNGCDAKGSLNSMIAKKSVIYTCHAGLTDMSAPIIVGNTYLGGMLCGQVNIKGRKCHVNCEKLSKELDIPAEKIKSALSKVKTVKYDRIVDSADFLYLFTNFIAKMGISNITHKKLLAETNEKMKFEHMARESQIKSIQSKVNPHFLFNTLNTIAGMAFIEEAGKTAKLIYSLSDILRYSIKNSQDTVKIKTEIENIKKYMYIQKIRYSDRLNYNINISKDILDHKIPVMTLQPIIENGIIHGLEPQANIVEIDIDGKMLDDKSALIKISDTGIGMTPEKLNKVIYNMNYSNNSNVSGLKIVKERLNYHFGEKSDIKIESTKNIGTVVYIKIPFTY
jgi:two-component system, LytTR family, sensor kinase